MRKLLLVLLTQFMMLLSYAQTISFPNDSVSLTQSSALGGTISMINRLTNTSSSTVSYHWSIPSYTKPFGWTFTICDNIACRAEGVDTGTFDLGAGLECVLVYDMLHHGTPGTGVGVMKIANAADPADTANIYFTGTMFLNTGIEAGINNINFDIYPNPMINTLHLRSDNMIKNASMIITNTLGQTVITINNINNNESVFDVSSLQKGVYIVTLKDEENQVLLRRSIFKN